jgi:hypothetical protein
VSYEGESVIRSEMEKTTVLIYVIGFLCLSLGSGPLSLKASLNRFNIVPTADCECGDGLQTEEHIFWDFKLTRPKGGTMMDILSENSKKE